MFKGSPAHVSTLAGPATRAGIRPVMSRHPAERRSQLPRVSRRLSATSVRFLSILSRRGVPPLSRSAYQHGDNQHIPFLDHGEVSTFRTYETRPDWVPPTPRNHAVLLRPNRTLRPPRAPSSKGQVLSPRSLIPSPGAGHHEASSGVHLRSPARSSPGLVIPRMDQGALGTLSSGFAPHRPGACDARRGGRRTIEHQPGAT